MRLALGVLLITALIGCNAPDPTASGSNIQAVQGPTGPQGPAGLGLDVDSVFTCSKVIDDGRTSGIRITYRGVKFKHGSAFVRCSVSGPVNLLGYSDFVTAAEPEAATLQCSFSFVANAYRSTYTFSTSGAAHGLTAVLEWFPNQTKTFDFLPEDCQTY